jgi:hypothetical protein
LFFYSLFADICIIQVFYLKADHSGRETGLEIVSVSRVYPASPYTWGLFVFFFFQDHEIFSLNAYLTA